MASVNKVILVGNLGRDPEMRYTAEGSAICNLSVATTHQWKDRNTGDRREETEWHRVSMFGRLAEIAGQYLKKGRPVYIEGRLRTRKYTDNNGVEKYSTEIVAEQMQMLGSRDAGSGDYGGDNYSSARDGSRGSEAPSRATGNRPAASFDDMDDDIPF